MKIMDTFYTDHFNKILNINSIDEGFIECRKRVNKYINDEKFKFNQE